ncbi:MAG: hypothetical protein ACLSCV_06255 [Acutalibacteraceae bacterium]
MMSFTTMNPETRRLIQVMPEDAARTSEMFDLLLETIYQEEKRILPKTDICISILQT